MPDKSAKITSQPAISETVNDVQINNAKIISDERGVRLAREEDADQF